MGIVLRCTDGSSCEHRQYPNVVAVLTQLLCWDTVGAEHERQKQMACHLLNDPGTNDLSQNITLLLLAQSTN
jgi:hypothetical protein